MALPDTDWMDHAACAAACRRGQAHHNWWFADRGSVDDARAAAICNTCTVGEACEQYAIATGQEGRWRRNLDRRGATRGRSELSRAAAWLTAHLDGGGPTSRREAHQAGQLLHGFTPNILDRAASQIGATVRHHADNPPGGHAARWALPHQRQLTTGQTELDLGGAA